MANEGGESGPELPLPVSPRHFGQLPDLGVPDDVDEPLPTDDWPIDDLDDWPFDDPSVDVARLRESLMESEADLAAGRTFGEDEIRARYGLRRSPIGTAEQETAYLLRSPENARRLMEAVARDKVGRPQREKEVDEHVAAGQVTVHEDTDAFLDHLDQLGAQADDARAMAEPGSSQTASAAPSDAE
jgi:PHD/YefM family antitoxin component YafN of YafNO toxin-antitoxin module